MIHNVKSIRANGKDAYKDFDLLIDSRNTPLPDAKEILDSVPFQHGSYDFSAMYGEVAYSERTISYSFDIAEASIQAMDQVKRDFTKWLMSIRECDIFDDYVPNYHFRGTAISPDWKEDASQGKITAKFRVYPFMIANEPTIFNFSVNSAVLQPFEIVNNSSHSIVPRFVSTAPFSIKIGNMTFSMPTGESSNNNVKFPPGKYNISLSGTAEVNISFFEEVF